MSSKTFFRIGDRYTAVSTNDDRVVEIKNLDKVPHSPSYFTNLAEWRASLPAETADLELQTSKASPPKRRTIDPHLRDGALLNAIQRHFRWSHYSNIYYYRSNKETIGEFIAIYEEQLEKHKCRWTKKKVAELYKLRDSGVPLTQLYAVGYPAAYNKMYVMDTSDAELIPVYYKETSYEHTLMYKGRVGNTCAELGIPCDSDGRPVLWIRVSERIYKLDYSTVL
jgi:hypothetical protein